MLKSSVTLLLFVCVITGCTGEKDRVREELFSKHARCAALYAILEKSAKTEEQKAHFVSSLTTHTKIGMKLDPSADKLKAVFDNQVGDLYLALSETGNPSKDSERLSRETGLCVEATIAYARFIGASPYDKP